MVNKFILVMSILGFISFLSKRNHLLMTLMSIEFLSLMLFSGIIFMSIKGVVDGCLGLFYLVISACEGALGLSIIVVSSRGVGGDLIYSSMTLQC